MSKHLDLWNSVEKTNPNHIKKVNQRGGFTAIDAHYQIKKATSVFGPIGDGWGYDIVHDTLTVNDDIMAVADVTLWHGTPNNKYGPWRGVSEYNPLSKSGRRLDTDAPKKAATDAITKALSHLGVCADVFLGAFDGDKYEKGKEWDKQQEDQHKPITDQQRKFLQAFYSNDPGYPDKEARLASLTMACKREITSMNEMTTVEASRLIDSIKKSQEG